MVLTTVYTLAAGLTSAFAVVPAPGPGILEVVAGTGHEGKPTPGPATKSDLDAPTGAAVDASGDLYIADEYNFEVEKVTPAGALSVVAGTGTHGAPTPGPATKSDLGFPIGVAVDDITGDLYIADLYIDEIEKVTPAGALSVVAGTGDDGKPTPGPATSSDLRGPAGVAVDDITGDLYIADTDNFEVEKVTPAGALSVVAGTGTLGAPTPGLATKSDLDDPAGVAVDDASGDLYIADTNNNEVEKVTPAGVLSVVAGIPGSYGKPTPGPATKSDLDGPTGVAVDASGDLYIADADNYVVEKVTPAGALSVVAGTGTLGAPTPGLAPGPATKFKLGVPSGVAVDTSGNLYIADSENNEVEEVGSGVAIPAPPPPGKTPPVTGTITTTTLITAVVPPSPVYYGTRVTFDAKVIASRLSSAPVVGAPTGTVTFSVPDPGALFTGGKLILCSAALVPDGLDVSKATCSSTKATVGDDTVTARYGAQYCGGLPCYHSPTSNYPSSYATAKLVVDSRDTTTTVTVSPGVAGLGTVLTYRAFVTGAGSDPAGLVRFSVTGVTATSSGHTYSDTTLQCSHDLSNGSASCHAIAPGPFPAAGSAPAAPFIVNAPDDVTATYVPTGVAHIGSSGHATLDVFQLTGSNNNFDGAKLNAVSCATAKFCVAVDNQGDENTYAHGHWSSADVDPQGSNSPTNLGLLAVSCPTDHFCAAVGSDKDGTGGVVVYNGSSWSSLQEIAAVPPAPEGDVGLVAVSCASPSFCMAADAYGNAYYYNGSSWSGPSSLNLPSSDEVTSLSCTKPDNCTAVTLDGNVAFLSGTGGAANGQWLPPRGGGVSSFSAVSCPTPNACTAVGTGAGSGSPGAILTTSPEGQVRQTSRPLSAVSCASTTFCVAVGDDSDQGPFALIYAGYFWSGTTPLGFAGADLTSISCPSTIFCMAVGDQGAVTWSGASSPESSPH